MKENKKNWIRRFLDYMNEPTSTKIREEKELSDYIVNTHIKKNTPTSEVQRYSRFPQPLRQILEQM